MVDLEKVIDGLIEKSATRKEVERSLDIIATSAKKRGNSPEDKAVVDRINRILTNMHHKLPATTANKADGPIYDKLQKHFDNLDASG